MILPRQARDKHRENSKKSGVSLGDDDELQLNSVASLEMYWKQSAFATEGNDTAATEQRSRSKSFQDGACEEAPCILDIVHGHIILSPPQTNSPPPPKKKQALLFPLPALLAVLNLAAACGCGDCDASFCNPFWVRSRRQAYIHTHIRTLSFPSIVLLRSAGTLELCEPTNEYLSANAVVWLGSAVLLPRRACRL